MASPEPTVTFVDLNILPREMRPHPYRAVGWLFVTAAIVTAAWALSFAAAVESDVRAETAALAEQSALLDDQVGATTADATRLAALRDTLAAVERSAGALELQRELLVGPSHLTSARVDEALRALPLGARIELINASLNLAPVLVLSGEATGPRAVLEYARTLEQGDLFENVNVTSVQVLDPDSDDPTVLFVVEAGW
jgi:hypothetical protein